MASNKLNLEKLNICPGTLAVGFNTYSPIALRRVFDNKRVSHILRYNSPKADDDDAEKFIENRERISISGVQLKSSMLLDKNKLRLTEEGEQGTYILKPVPSDVKNPRMVPANEHLTMQIARQIFDINTAENAMIFFKDGEPAYITKRFDVNAEGKKINQEDFASLSGKSKDTGGPDYKYTGSYEDLGDIIKKYSPAYIIELEKLFSLILFNYIFSNGDAHLKNFSLSQTVNGDYILSRAYDLINTRLHVGDSDFALENGLFKDDFKSASYKKSGHASLEDFRELGRRFGINEKRLENILSFYSEKKQSVEDLINNSYLDYSSKKSYVLSYFTKLNYLKK